MTTNEAPTTRCETCHRPLRAAASIAARKGRTCLRRARAEAAYKPAQVAKAREVIELGAIAATPIRTERGRRVFVVIASSGTDRYFTTRTACTCPAGLKGRRCYHQLSAIYAA